MEVPLSADIAHRFRLLGGVPRVSGKGSGKGDLNARLGKSIKTQKSRRHGKNVRRSLAGLALLGSICLLALVLMFGK